MGNKSKRTIKTQTKPFDLDALEKEAQAKASDKNFRFLLGGREFVLPPFGTIDRKVLTSMDPDDPDSIMNVFKAAMSEEDFEEFDELELSIDGLTSLEEAWSEHSGMTPGE